MREHSRAFPGLPWLGGPIAADPNPFAQRRGLLRYVSDGARIQCLVPFGKGLAGARVLGARDRLVPVDLGQSNLGQTRQVRAARSVNGPGAPDPTEDT